MCVSFPVFFENEKKMASNKYIRMLTVVLDINRKLDNF